MAVFGVHLQIQFSDVYVSDLPVLIKRIIKDTFDLFKDVEAFEITLLDNFF